MLIDPLRSCLLLVDIQEKLVPAIHQREQLIEGARWLLGVAEILTIPVLVSEQYPQGLGHTIEPLQHWCNPNNTFSKQHFSCVADDGGRTAINAVERPQVVIVGMEAHVCVLQTALGLLADDKEVFVVADAVGSRNPTDKQLALARLAQLGVQVVSREMVAFEWMQRSGSDSFKQISKGFLR